MSMPSASALSSCARPNSPDQRLAGRGDGVARGHAGLGLDVEDELVEVGALLDAGGLDLVGHLQHRRVDGVDRDAADLLAGLLVLHGGDVAAAALDGQLDLEPALAVQRGQVQVGAVDLDAGGRRDVGGGDRAGALLAQVHDDRLVALGGDDELLEVQDQVGDVLLDARHGGELVQDAVDPDARDRSAGDRGQQGAAERVAEGVAETGLERLEDEARAVLGDGLLGQGGALCDEHEVSLQDVPRGPPYDLARGAAGGESRAGSGSADVRQRPEPHEGSGRDPYLL
jgi:hypothetical protein